MLNESLYEVQKIALKKGHLMSGFAYFLEMGLGKTRVTLYDAYWHMKSRRVDVAVILCPKSLRTAWEDEARDIEFPYPVVLAPGSVEQCIKLVEGHVRESRACVLVIHYDIALTKGGDIIEALLEKHKIFLALDESTRIKNPKARLGNYLRTLRRKFKYIRLLSGSPAPQGPHDLWAQFQLVGATNRTFTQFKHRYCEMGGFKGKKVEGYKNLPELRKETGNNAFRAKKKDWTDIPDKIYMPVRVVEMTAFQKKLYNEMREDFTTRFQGVEVTVKMAANAKNKLQQIGSGFMYDNDGDPVYLFKGGEKNPKLEEMVSVLEEIENKTLIFYNFKPSLKILKERLDEAGVKYVVLGSGLSDDDIRERKRQFNEEDEIDVAICQIGAIKYGHTLLGTANRPCHNTIFYENNYDLEARGQAEDRNHRHGQKNVVGYTDIAVSGEDKNVLRSLQTKSNIQESIMLEFE